MRTIGLTFVILILAGCGQYGPLQLPDKPDPAPITTTQK
jgi:predicted small lipoprotein YifL